MMYKRIRIGRIQTSRNELISLLKAWLAISLAFTIIRGGLSAAFPVILVVSAFTVGLGFLLHELAHKFAAQHYGCEAEFAANDQMLLLAIILSFVGFIFAAPGAVMIFGHVTHRENGIISVVGPLTNYILALLFLGLAYLYPSLGFIFLTGFSINAWLGLFNMLPFLMLDGKKVMLWNMPVFAGMLGFGIYLVFIL